MLTPAAGPSPSAAPLRVTLDPVHPSFAPRGLRRPRERPLSLQAPGTGQGWTGEELQRLIASYRELGKAGGPAADDSKVRRARRELRSCRRDGGPAAGRAGRPTARVPAGVA